MPEIRGAIACLKRLVAVQPDNGAGLTKGIIGLVNQGQPRKPEDWGALRAWAWGASRGLDYLETDNAVNARQAGIEGVSVARPADLAEAVRAAVASGKPCLIDANIGADKNPGGAGVWELPGLGVSAPVIGGRYRPE